MKHSVNYNLNKPDYVDQFDLRHWNENVDIIDSVLKDNENAINDEVEARENTDAEIVKIKNGDTIVKNAENAENAEKANKDGNGRDIATELDKKLEVVKINGTDVTVEDKGVNLQVSFRISDGEHTGSSVNMSNGLVTIQLPSQIYGAVFN